MNKKILAVLVLAPLAAHAQAYRWVDAQGKVHYTQTPPPQQAPESVQAVRPPPMLPSSKAGAAAATPQDRKQSLAKYARDLEKANNKTDEARAKAEEEVAKREANCKEARGDMRSRDEFEGRTFTTNENGEREYWSAEKNAQVRQRIQKAIDDNCG